jgi:hypothetical protein
MDLVENLFSDVRNSFGSFLCDILDSIEVSQIDVLSFSFADSKHMLATSTDRILNEKKSTLLAIAFSTPWLNKAPMFLSIVREPKMPSLANF